jgi:molybdopterin molybdotransferase
MLSVAEALAVVLAHTSRLPSEVVALEAALGRVLATPVTTDLDLPPFDRAAMDGFALRALDAVGPGAVLRVTGQVRAGHGPPRALAPGEAFEIMTGAVLPPGADAVLQVELTRRLEDGARVELLAAVQPGLNVAARASEARRGDVVLAAGTRVDPAVIAVLASVGGARVAVARRPTVAVLATGDELVEVHVHPAAGQIRNSNAPTVAAQARLAGAEVRVLPSVPDEADALLRALAEGLYADVLVVSGGVSEGAFDLVEPMLQRLGVTRLFERVAIKPGAPLVFGVHGPRPGLVFGLPGNPVSAQVTFDVFVRPALLALQGASRHARARVEAVLTDTLRNASGRSAYLPVALECVAGRWAARPLRSQGSADVRTHAQADGLALLPTERRLAAAGEVVSVLLLGREHAAHDAEQPAPTESKP